jgi:hypothetical protein
MQASCVDLRMAGAIERRPERGNLLVGYCDIAGCEAVGCNERAVADE